MKLIAKAPVLVITIGAALLTITACSDSRSASAGSKMTSSDLEHAVKARLAADDRTAKLGVSADIDKNQITLSGDVPTEAVRMQAVDVAKAARPGLMVIDKIDVKPDMKPAEVSRSDYTEEMGRNTRERARAAGNTVGSSLEDAWIYTKAESKLFADKDVTSRHINVDVTDKVVTLRGTVPTRADKEEAEHAVRSIDGVVKVQNHLRVANGNG